MTPFIGAALPALLLQCGPSVSPDTLAAIMQVESGRHSWAINDNNTGKAYFPTSREQAQQLAHGLLAQGHKLAIGSMQIHSQWLGRLGLTPAALLDPCTSIRVASRILQDNYRVCAGKGFQQAARLDCALTAYWSGRFTPQSSYVGKVRAHAGGAVASPALPTAGPARPGAIFAADGIFAPARADNIQRTRSIY